MGEEKKNICVENLRVEYREVCQSHRAITDFRAKLLTLLPLASGTGIFFLLRKQSESALLDLSYLAEIGVFGFVVTLGLFFHELRGILHCGDLIKLGTSLEAKMGLRKGQFSLEHDYYNPKGRRRIFRRICHQIVGPVGAAWIIYPSVCGGWLYVAAVGLKISIASLVVPFFGALVLAGLLWSATDPSKGRAGGSEQNVEGQ